MSRRPAACANPPARVQDHVRDTTRGLRRAVGRGLLLRCFTQAVATGCQPARRTGLPVRRLRSWRRIRRHDGRGDRLAGPPNRPLTGGMAGPGRGVRYRPAGPERGAPLAALRARCPAEQPVGHRRCRRASRRVGAAQCRGVRRWSVPRRQGRPAPDLRRPRQRHHGARRGRPGRGPRRLHAVVRGRQFAAVAAAARDRVDLGLRFTDPPASGRLQPASAPGQATHKVAVRSVADVDDELLHLVRVAYDQNP